MSRLILFRELAAMVATLARETRAMVATLTRELATMRATFYQWLPRRLRLAIARILFWLELIPARARFYYRRLAARITRQPQALIKTTYDIVTPESAQYGDVDSSGWIDESGEVIEPDPYDIAEGITRADLALDFLREQGYLEPSSSACGTGVWYTVYAYNQGTREYYETGAEESRSYHLDGFTEAEQAYIFERIND